LCCQNSFSSVVDRFDMIYLWKLIRTNLSSSFLTFLVLIIVVTGHELPSKISLFYFWGLDLNRFLIRRQNRSWLFLDSGLTNCAWLLDYKIKNDYNQFVQVLHGANFVLQERVCISICSSLMCCIECMWLFIMRPKVPRGINN
jgi:hypothetical protein